MGVLGKKFGRILILQESGLKETMTRTISPLLNCWENFYNYFSAKLDKTKVWCVSQRCVDDEISP